MRPYDAEAVDEAGNAMGLVLDDGEGGLHGTGLNLAFPERHGRPGVAI